MEAQTNTTQKMSDGAEITISGKKYTVAYQVNDSSMIWLTGVRGGVNFLRGVAVDNGVYTVVSWKSGQPVVNKRLEPLRVVLLGNMLEDVTGKNI